MINVLIVCTANQCRSPMAEGILRHRVEGSDLDVHVSSAGIMQGGAPATDHAVSVCADRGVDITGHVSRRLDRSIVDGADLIICMAREHLREVVVTSSPAFERTFTLRELARRIEANPHASLAELHVGRQLADYVKGDPNDDVADPVGKPRSRYEETAWQLDGLLTRVATWLPNLGDQARRAAS
ncbi:MAG TPA: hypothetical protein VHC63_14780 [Acidimicrobiales bacterium]|nr:hypothetical protein [Acidimicrobiales bacterium]